MIKAAIAECEDMLRLNKNDNLGVRYTLMFLYAFMEDEEKALKLYKKSNEKNVQMLLSLSILYFRKRNLEETLKYLKKIENIVKDTRKFFKDVLDGKMEKYSAQIYDMGYRLFTSDELAISFIENHFIFDIDNGYIEWAYNRLKKKLKMVKRKKK
ncbi:MAG: hypothetical protein Q4D53_05470 [Leptotrichiaceae bacterium]|nr:hypothetical protein [Leptotrichiaceae bacterium]